ncbi:MAG: helix-hairpin-helix domain-containing protein [Firmicutes bacterium]|nr:helix-hairpin-helix domain-containing protein [Bacillota bacterium]
MVVPGKKEVAGRTLAAAAPGSSGRTGSTTVNINTANLEQLDSLPGIGPALAQRIMEFRDTNGPFKSVQDLQKVPGIGARKFEQLSRSVVIQ